MTVASAPGKLIVMGEHAAVYGRPALVAALDLRTRCRIARRGDKSGTDAAVRLCLETFGHEETVAWAEILRFGAERRECWRRYRADPSPERFEALRTTDPASVVKIVLAESVQATERPAAELPSLDVHLGSELPVGAGLGSSASVAVAVAGAFVVATDGRPDPDLVAVIAEEAERRQHGTPSGVDHRTVLKGGWQLFRPGAASAGRMETGGSGASEASYLEVSTRLEVPSWLDGCLAAFNTGTPVETTGEVVAAVRARKDQDSEFDALLDRMGEATLAAAEALAAGESRWPDLLDAVKRFERCLERIGVVPEPVARAIVEIEAAGAAAKISGAGALSGAAAGMLIVFRPRYRDLPDPDSLLPAGTVPVPGGFGGPGLRWET